MARVDIAGVDNARVDNAGVVTSHHMPVKNENVLKTSCKSPRSTAALNDHLRGDSYVDDDGTRAQTKMWHK